jgi:hypothetical protein
MTFAACVLLLLTASSTLVAPAAAAAPSSILRGAGTTVGSIGAAAREFAQLQLSKATVEEVEWAALVEAFSGGEAAVAAKLAARGELSEPVPFKLTNCDPTAAIQVRERASLHLSRFNVVNVTVPLPRVST